MPLYDYKCSQHGVFQELATMADHDKPGQCPVCQQACGRVILLAPGLFGMNAKDTKARDRNEQASHQPVFSNADYRQEQAERKAFAHKHGKRCGCDEKTGKSKLFFTADGKKMFPSMRPWMISH